jgi:hypothetical protein
MDVSSLGSPPPQTPLERLKESLERSVERSGPNSLYSRMLKAQITRHEALRWDQRPRCSGQWRVQLAKQNSPEPCAFSQKAGQGFRT